MTRLALFPGAFDPPTIGHLDIIKRAPLICDKLIVAVGQNLGKNLFFSVEERLEMLRLITKGCPYVEIASFSGLSVKYAKERKVQFLIRGLRSIADFEHETQMAMANRKLSGGLETIFFAAQHAHVSSSLIREIAHFGGALKDFVPSEIETFFRDHRKI